MNKNKKKNGIPIISQIINLLDIGKIKRTAKENNSDKYYKKFKTYDHLITILYAVLSGCTSLREIMGLMFACEGRINHLGMEYFPKRSTISDANNQRSSAVFGKIYFDLLAKYRHIISDSRLNDPIIKNLKIVDSTTISLFSDIIRGVGRNPLNGKRKGGIKMHTMINASEDVPCLIRFTSAATHDHVLLKELELKRGSIVVFDRGYVDYSQYLQWSLEEVYFVTRLKDNTKYESYAENDIPEITDAGIIKDELIKIEKDEKTIILRKIAYWHDEQKKLYEFLTNNLKLEAEKIAQIYKRRWQIELLFKRLKQNFPLKYFLGDNQNAIEIQIWVSLIAQLLLLVVQKQVQRKWAFSNLASIVRNHLMTYMDLFRFLNKPEADWVFLSNKEEAQPMLFDYS